jgi:hypothetical protein
MIQADLDVVQLDLQAVLNDLSSGAPAATLQQDIQTLNAALAQLVQDETHFAADTQDDQSPGSGHDAAIRGFHLATPAALTQPRSHVSFVARARTGRNQNDAVDNVFAGLGRLL